jgi:hypothetical protein
VKYLRRKNMERSNEEIKKVEKLMESNLLNIKNSCGETDCPYCGSKVGVNELKIGHNAFLAGLRLDIPKDEKYSSEERLKIIYFALQKASPFIKDPIKKLRNDAFKAALNWRLKITEKK